jgi:type IV pilus assembly protein PilE
MMRTTTGQHQQTQTSGFSLIEVLIVVAIVGILASIAYPSFSEQTRKSKRADAKETLMRLAVAQEKYFIQKGSYTTDISSGLKNSSTESSEKNYTLTAQAGPTGSIATSYAVTATAKSGTSQAKDSDCISFSINSRNQRTAKTSGGSANSDCW